MTWRELVYMITDITKQISDDSNFNEDHIIFLCSKYRNYILNQQYLTNKKTINESDYQTIQIPLIPVNTEICPGRQILRSKEKISHTMTIGEKVVYPTDLVHYRSSIVFVDNTRFPYVSNKYTKNLIYAMIGPDQYLYLKSDNEDFIYLQSVTIKALFEDVQQMALLDAASCGCDIMDTRFPLEDAWVNTLINLVVNDLVKGILMLRDTVNDSTDKSDDLAQAISRFTNSQFKRLIQNNQSNNGTE